MAAAAIPAEKVTPHDAISCFTCRPMPTPSMRQVFDDFSPYFKLCKVLRHLRQRRGRWAGDCFPSAGVLADIAHNLRL
jgi:hypothetical protein